MLYIIATPIGNLKDITLRALDVLKELDLVACEDTRRTRILFDRYKISSPTTSYFEHNRIKKAHFLIGELKKGKNIGLVSDAGLPGLSDPGRFLINRAREEGIDITIIPGPDAALSSFVLSGFRGDGFVFGGFLPRKRSARKKKIKEMLVLGLPAVFYESPHRILKTLEDLESLDVEVFIARELTKKFEELLLGSPSDMLERFREKSPKGEFTLVVRAK